VADAGRGYAPVLPAVKVLTVVARAWRLYHVVAAMLVMVAIWVYLPSPTGVPGREGVSSVVWPLAPSLFALALPAAAETAYRDIDRTAGSPVARRRLAILACTVTIPAAGVGLAALTVHPEGPVDVVVRNGACMVGLALMGVVWLPRWAVWAPLVLVPAGMWILGTQPAGRPPAPWAILLHPSGSTAARAIALVTFGIGASAYLLRDHPVFD